MEKYWFVVSPDVFLWKKGHTVLAYNSDNFEIREFETCNKFNYMYDNLMKPENLYATELTEEDLRNAELYAVIKLLEQAKCAKLISQSEEPKCPVSLFPLAGVQRSREKLRKRPEMLKYENYLNYLQEVTIYVNGSGLNNNLYTRQVPYFISEGGNMDFNSLNLFLKFIASSSVSNIRICGYNIFEYTDWRKLLDLVDRIHTTKSLYVSCLQLQDHPEDWQIASSEQFKYIIVVDRQHPLLESVFFAVKEMELQVEWLFYVSSENEYSLALEQIEQYQIKKFSMKPVFTGDNLLFFSENVFLAKEDVVSNRLNKRQIFANQILNTNDFGKFILSPKGDIYVNLNFPPRGNINEKSIFSLIREELVWGDLWFRTRSEQPCSECLYQWLCPSPSNYELVLNQPNLCFIK